MTHKYVKTNADGYVISQPGAILNVDNAKLNAYKMQKNNIKKQKEYGERIEKLEDDIGEIKSMLQQLLKR